MPTRGYRSVTLPTKLVKAAEEVIRSPSGAKYRSMAELVSDALEEKLNRLRGVQLISVRDVSPIETTRRVTEYLRKNPGSHYPSDIANALGLDLELVFDVTNRLLSERIVELGEEEELVAK